MKMNQNKNISTLYNDKIVGFLAGSNLDYAIINSTRIKDTKARGYTQPRVNTAGEAVFPGFRDKHTYGLDYVHKHKHTLVTLSHSKEEHDVARQLLKLSGDIESNPGPVAEMIQTVYGSFYFGEEIHDFCELVSDIRAWYPDKGESCDFSLILFQPNDQKVFSLLSKLIWDEMHACAMFHLPYRFKNMFDDMDFSSEWAFLERLLMLAGDVETNPGPVLSRPSQNQYNDPRCVKLEKALERSQQKAKTLVKHLRAYSKQKKKDIFVQMFGDLKSKIHSTSNGVSDISNSLDKICNFLENSLPSIQANVQTTLLSITEQHINIKDDIIKVILLLLIIKLLLTWKKHKLALVVVLGFIAKFYNFDKYVLDLIKELREKMSNVHPQGVVEDVIYHPYFHTCGKLIFAILAFVCVKKIPGKQDWDNYLLRLDRIPKSIDGSKKIVDYCSEYFGIATDYIKMMVLGKTREELKRANGLYQEIKDWAEEVRFYLDLEERGKIDTDITVANKVEDLYKRGVKYQADTLLDKEVSRLVSTTLLPARELYQYVSSSPVKGGGPRMRPICLWLGGESGVGKTEMVYPLCIDLLRTMGLVKEQDFHHQVYGRQVETEYWDGYKGQKIVIYDDAFQMKDDKTSPNPEIFEVIRSCNTFPQHLHMAALHDKNTFSSAEVLLYTTNDMNVKLESITFPEAFYSRMGENAYRVMPKKEFSILVEKGASGRVRRKLNVEAIDPSKPIDLNVYEFQKIIRDSSSEVSWIDYGEPIGYDEFCRTICSKWREEKQKSLDKLKWLSQYAIRPQMGSECEYYDCYDTMYYEKALTDGFAQGRDLIDIEAEFASDDIIWTNYLDYKIKIKQPSIWQKYRDRIDVCLVTVKTYLSKLLEECKSIIVAHPYLSILGFVGLIFSSIALYKQFMTLEDEEKSSIEEWEHLADYCFECDPNNELCDEKFKDSSISGVLKCYNCHYASGVIDDKPRRLVEVMGSGDSKTAKVPKTRVEVGVSGDSKTNKVPRIKIESLDDKLKHHVTTQGCNDEVAHRLVVDVVQKNIYHLTYSRDNKDYSMGNCTFLRGFTFIMPYHFVVALYARKVLDSTVINFSQSNKKNIISVPISHIMRYVNDGFELTDNCIRLTHTDGSYRDCVMINLHTTMCFPHRDLIKHFVSKSDQGFLKGKFCGALATFHKNKDELCRTYQWLASIQPVDKIISVYWPEDGYDYGEECYTQRDCYQYNAPTQMGDCGSVVGLYNGRIERKIVGMHIAGDDKINYGYACPLTQEVLEESIAKLVNKKKTNISAQFYYEVCPLVDSEAEPVVPEGLFVPIGKSTLRIGQATKTNLQKSILYGKLSTSYMAPSLLKPSVVNGVFVDPLMQGLKKCGVDTAIFPVDEVLSAAQDVKQVVLTQYNDVLDRRKYQRVLTYEEAVRGTLDDDYMCAINRTTSPGFPYTLQKGKFPGKTKWLGKDQDFDFESKDALQLRADVENLLEDCAQGKICGVFCVDTLKDEKRDLAKVLLGKTRVFSACPQHFVIAFRRYFLPFSAWLMHNRIDNEIAVGTNVYSLDWEHIAKKLKLKGPLVIAGDFGNFDGSLAAQVLWSIFWQIFVPWLEIYDSDEKTLRICLGLWMHLVHSVHIFGDNVYMWTHSQPSGNPFTVIINCLYNSIIMRIAWIKIMKKTQPQLCSMKHFRKNVSMVAYGDDNVLNISNSVIELYNQQTLSDIMMEMKHEYTDEAKTGEIVKFRSLDEVYFLKRQFKFSEELQRHVAPLKLSVIYEMLNWTRNTIDPNEILMMNIETAFREIVYHGREEYEKLKLGIEQNQYILPSIPQILTYESYLHDIKELADPLYDF